MPLWDDNDFNLQLRPSFKAQKREKAEDPYEIVRDARSWFASAKQALLATYGVGTIDQALQAVVAVKHFFVRRFALAGKVVVLDEVHSYDIYTGTLIKALIRELVNLRCAVVILSATLTAAARRELLAAAGVTCHDSPTAYPLVTTAVDGRCRHAAPGWKPRPPISLRATVIPEDETLAELVQRAETGQHVLWIRNTVVEAQASFRAACSTIREESIRVGLLHSRFPFARRAELEELWLELLGKNRPAKGPGTILIATQVVEQSVDIDLDFIVSDLVPTDMLLQRLGRLWRHERSQRAALVPQFWVRLPDLSSEKHAAELTRSLGRSARVYAPYILLRSMQVWQKRTAITLPTDIRPLLEATYAEPDGDEPQSWRDLHDDLEKEKRDLALNAEAATRVLGYPLLSDKEEVLTRRKGPPTMPVVLFRSITGGLNGLTTLVALDGSRIEISDNEWQRLHARFLQHRMVRAPRRVVVVNGPRPRWLDLHGPSDAVVAVVRADGRCKFDDEVSAMNYDPRLGIFAERSPQTSPQNYNDNDDEFDY